MNFSGRTRLVFLAGDPVGHTKGYAEYAQAFAQSGIDAAYVPAAVPAGRLPAFLAGLRWAGNLAGVVATAPHKLDALAAGRPDLAARRAGSANVLRPAADGGWACAQVDGAGFLAAADGAGMALAGRIVQVLGTGGAGRAVAMAIAERGPALLSVDDPERARRARLADDLRREFPGLPVEAGLRQAEMLVNCSSVGVGGDDRLPLPAAMLPDRGDVFDIVNRPDTKLLELAAQRGCRRENGRSMMLAEIPLIVRFLFGPDE